jgi:cardiolipin synthase
MDLLNWAVVGIHFVVAPAAAGHALLYKRDPRAAWAWIGACLLFPLLGPFLYFLFGINRVRSRARRLHQPLGFRFQVGYERAEATRLPIAPTCNAPREYRELMNISNAITKLPVVAGNEIELLLNGEQAYPQMLAAIASARCTLYLTTYIFETNFTGGRFIEALADAHQRGVQVKVMIDGMGELYSLPRAGGRLRKRGVSVVRFHPPKLFPPELYINLRNHRKILVVDGRLGFTGGMNIGDRHLANDRSNPGRVADAHFRLTGPIVRQLEQVFVENWDFATGEHTPVTDEPVEFTGGAHCRTVVDGPDENMDKLATILVGAASAAKLNIALMTPYFLPSRELIGALQSAALRGVRVEIILPSLNNLPYVHWASRNLLWELLQYGVSVYYQPPPFVHTKLFVVDGHYAHIGSANIDPRSLRLNFELVVEVYDRRFAEMLLAHFERTRSQSRAVSLEEMDNRPLPIRVRDALFWLFSPYL